MKQTLSATWLWFAAFIALVDGQAIPGTKQTISGYDTSSGVDAICWRSEGTEAGGSGFTSELIPDFETTGVEMLQACPMGVNVSGTQPLEHSLYGERLRTRRLYDYPVKVNLNLTSLRAPQGFTSIRGPGYIVAQIFNCVAGLSGFCSPFIHEQTIAQDIAAARAAAAANPGLFSGPPPPWRYIPGDLHGESHAHSGWWYAILALEDGPIYKDIEMKIPQLVMVPGSYYSIVALQLFFWEESTDGGNRTLVRYDIANKLEGQQSLTYYYDPPEIQKVDYSILTASYVIIGLAGAVIIYLLFHALKNLNNQVMRLSQGNFLVVFLVAGLTGTACVVFARPRNDLYCQAFYPTVLIPLQLFYAVTAGRLWRIHSLISPLLLKTLATDTPWSRFKTWFRHSALGRCFGLDQQRPQKIRAQVTETQLALLVTALTLPQVIIQVLSIVLQPTHMDIDLNDDESKGRTVCRTKDDLSFGETLENWGLFVFCILVLGLLFMALQSRKLPSLFNESEKIFDSALTSTIILVLGIAIQTVTDTAETSPSVGYLLKVFVVLSITVNTSWRIVYPKLQMIWRGETVIVSQLVMDHAKEQRSLAQSTVNDSMKVNDSKPGTSAYIYDPNSIMNSQATPHSSFKPESSASFTSIQRHSSIIHKESSRSESQSEVADPTLAESPEASDQDGETSPKNQEGTTNDTTEETEPLAATVQTRRPPKVKIEVPKGASSKSGKKISELRKPEITIEPDKAPSRRLLLKMVDLQEHLGRVTQRIMSGMAVSEADWEHARSLGGRFGHLMNDQVQFSWEAAIAEAEGESFLNEIPDEAHEEAEA